METVTVFEAKTRFGKHLARVTQGEEVIITRHKKPVARLVPAGRWNLASVGMAVDGLLELSSQIAQQEKGRAKPTKAMVKAWIEEGRRFQFRRNNCSSS